MALETRYKVYDFKVKAFVEVYVAKPGADPFILDEWEVVKTRMFNTVKEAKRWIRQDA